MVAKVLGLNGPAVRGALGNPDDFDPNVRLSSDVIFRESLGRAAGFL
jgi:hypothetical protein